MMGSPRSQPFPASTTMLSASPRSKFARPPVLGARNNMCYPPFESDERAARVAQERGAKILAQPLSPRHGRRAVPPPRKLAGPTTLAPSAAEFNNILRSRVEKGLNKRYGGATRAFEKFDKDRNGAISYEEGLKGILSLQLGVPRDRVNELIMACDFNGDGVIDYDEFKQGIMHLSRDGNFGQFGALDNKPRMAMAGKADLGDDTGVDATEAEVTKYLESLRTAIDAKYNLLRKAFQAADADRSNSLTSEEISEVIKNFALPIPSNHVDQLLRAFDKNTDGKISYQEFCNKLSQLDS